MTKQKETRGKKTELTKKLQSNLARHIKAGSTITEACALEEISTSAYHEWIARGEGRDPTREKTELFADFANAMRRAKAEGCRTRTKKIIKHGDKDWKALAYINRVTAPHIYSEAGIIKRGVEEELQKLHTNLFWMMSAEAYQEMTTAIALCSEYNLNISQMTEMKAIQVLMETQFVPEETRSAIGIAYLELKDKIKQEIFSTNGMSLDKNGNRNGSKS